MMALCDKKSKYSMKDVVNFHMVQYDEGYGISGRLLALCTTKKEISFSNVSPIHCEYSSTMFQFFNQSELIPLKDELTRINYQLLPGSSMNERKPFNLTVFVYEMLYGTEYIDALLQSEEFNPALVGGDDNENEIMLAAYEFPSHMSLEEVMALGVEDKIDHRDSKGRFVIATVIEKQGGNIKIHYD